MTPSSSGQPSTRQISALLIVGTLAVSTAPVLIALTPLDPAIKSAWRLIITALVMVPWAWKSRHQLKELSASERKLLPISGVLFGLHFLFFIAAFEFTSFESAVLLLAMQPVLAAVMASVMLKEKITKGMWISSMIALSGMSLLGYQDFIADHQSGGWNNLFGDLLVLLGGVVIVLAIIIGRRIRKKMDFPLYTSVVFGIGGVMNLAVGLALGEAIAPSSEDGMGWLWLGLLVLVPTICGHNLFNYLVRHVRVFFLNLVILAEPVIAMLMRWAIDDPERLGRPDYTPERVVGSVVLMLGVLVGLIIRDKEQSPDGPDLVEQEDEEALSNPAAP